MIKALCIKTNGLVKLRLLGGAPWKDVSKLKSKITAIAMALHEKRGVLTKGVVFGETQF